MGGGVCVCVGGGGDMPDILDILFSINSRCRVHAYV